jgi:hypothetical protein
MARLQEVMPAIPQAAKSEPKKPEPAQPVIIPDAEFEETKTTEATNGG